MDPRPDRIITVFTTKCKITNEILKFLSAPNLESQRSYPSASVRSKEKFTAAGV